MQSLRTNRTRAQIEADDARRMLWQQKDDTHWVRIARHYDGLNVQVALLIEKRGSAFRCTLREGSACEFYGYASTLYDAKIRLDALWNNYTTTVKAILRRGK